ncbi:MAG: poly(R)-hydroxyalkanoic acid synthase subunit PhaE [Gammaproteobacteria bacterium]
MSESDPIQAWFTAWKSAWGPGSPSAGAEVGRRLIEIGQEYAGIARDSWKFFGSAPGAAAVPAAAAMQAAFADSYRRLLMPAAPFDPAGMAAAPAMAAAAMRCQRAMQALATEAGAIANDASRRLVLELSREDRDAEPVASLRALHELWVECGEAAWASAVHQDSYAAAQAEWLAALVEFTCEQRRLTAPGAGGSPP